MCWDKESLLGILPQWIRRELASQNLDSLQEVRLRIDGPPELILTENRLWIKGTVQPDDLNFCINTASSYSPWAADTVQEGYLTTDGGHRIGICGEAAVQNGTVLGIRRVTSLCIRIARDLPEIAEKARALQGSILILGAPGWGKTTLLRDLIRQRSRGESVSVVDERGELFPKGFRRGLQTDVLTGVSKAQGILQVLKTMGPQTIAVDEITSPEDVSAVLTAAGCGVSLLATVHASSMEELKGRSVTRQLLGSHVFDYFLVLQKNQTYEVERMEA